MRTQSRVQRRGWVLLALEAVLFALLVGLLVSAAWSVSRGAPRRRRLIEVTDALTSAIAQGRRFSAQNNVIVSAHFSLGTSSWSVASGAPDVASTTSILSLKLGPTADEETTGKWRFLDFRSLSGQAVGPSFVFFPDGNLQGGEVELGWPDLRRNLRMERSGEIVLRFVTPPRKKKGDESAPPFYDDTWKGAAE
ncbi:hypothetical protein JW916_04465 [Candidatus Sumerlaeota bacterium]|nr:hypothetical protein [Candidatus Sumerlaeota bacterium]